MIVRPVDDTAELAMQVDHAEVAGQLAAAWGGPNVPALDPRDSMLTAVRLHDSAGATGKLLRSSTPIPADPPTSST